MKKYPSPFSRITRTSNQLNSLIFVALPLLLVLLAALFWSTERIIEQEKRRLEVDFSSYIGYLREQETFLLELAKENNHLSEIIESRSYSLKYQKTPEEWPLSLLEGKESLVGMPFTLACDNNLECTQLPSILFSLGAYLADYYSTFWGASYFPAAAVFFVNEHDNISISVPAVNTLTGNEIIDPELFKTVTETVRYSIPDIRKKLIHYSNEQDQLAKHTREHKVIWIHSPELGNDLVGIIPAGFDFNLWQGAQLSPKDIYAVTLFNPKRISVLERILNPTLDHNFWLIHHQYGQLLGSSVLPEGLTDGLNYTKDGLFLKLHNKTGEWIGYYQVKYNSFFDDNLWLPLSLIGAIFFSLLCGWLYHLWYNRVVLEPAITFQNQLLESESFNRTLIDTTPIGICVISKADQKIIFANPLAEMWLRLPKNDNPFYSREYRRFISSLSIENSYGNISSFTSGEFTLYIAYTYTYYRQQEVILCAFTDITKQIEIEQQLDKARIAAEDASRAKSNFLSTMSHEIRTPLYGLIGTLELLSTTELSEQQEQYLNRISTVSQLLMRLISDILDVNKIEANQLNLHNQPFDMLDTIHSLIETHTHLASKKGLLLFSCIDCNIAPERLGDAYRLQQILGNLLSNAIKFTDVGSIKVYVSSKNNQIHISVVDTGIGLSLHQKEKLFVPFFQAHNKQHTYGGTGLGLFICKHLVTLMGGTINVESEINKGSQFTIKIPFPASPNQKEWPNLSGMLVWLQTPHQEITKNIASWLTHWKANTWTGEIEPQENNINPTRLYIGMDNIKKSMDLHKEQIIVHDLNININILSKQLSSIHNNDDLSQASTDVHIQQYDCTVLIAEDNPINQAVLTEQLKLFGCNILLANDGEEALAIWDSHNGEINLILTDVNMPYMDGYKLTQTLRDEGAICPIIGVTANGLKDEEERCLSSGMNDWLVKPLELKRLSQLLEQYFISKLITDEHLPINLINPLETKDRKKTIKYLQNDLTLLRNAIEQKNTNDIKQIAHRLRGALSIVNREDISAQLQKLEIKQAEQKNDEIYLDEWKNICDILERWLTLLSQPND